VKKLIPLLILSGLVIFSSSIGNLRADEAAAAAAGQKDLKAAIIGTWRAVSMKVDNRTIDLPDSQPRLKHVTPDGFTWLAYEKDSGKMTSCAGGTYTLKGDKYTETIQYGMGSDYDAIKNDSHSFTCKIDGDTWHHVGALANGQTIDETWQRVKPTPKEEK